MAKAKGVTSRTSGRLAAALPGVEVVHPRDGHVALKADGKFSRRLKEDGETLVLRMDIVSRDLPSAWLQASSHHRPLRDYPRVLIFVRGRRRRATELLEDAWRLVAPRKRTVAYDGGLKQL
jgi:hypothetical protein